MFPITRSETFAGGTCHSRCFNSVACAHPIAVHRRKRIVHYIVLSLRQTGAGGRFSDRSEDPYAVCVIAGSYTFARARVVPNYIEEYVNKNIAP